MNHRAITVIGLAGVVAAVACTDTVALVPTGPSARVLSASAELPDAVPQPNVTIIVLVHHLPDGGIEGTWTATGAFTDAGIVEWTDFDVAGGPPIFTPGHVFAKNLLSSDRGTFLLETREHFNIAATDPPNTWVAGRGTGFYESLEGRGTFTVTHSTESAPGYLVITGYVRL